jgi:putative transposase
LYGDRRARKLYGDRADMMVNLLWLLYDGCWVALCLTQPTVTMITIMEYRRAKVPGGTYFFTLVTYNRKKLFNNPQNVELLRKSFRYVMEKHPFILEDAVILPDHLHCIWQLPEGDHNFSTRWRLIKSYFSRKCEKPDEAKNTKSRIKKQEKAIWQRRFWEHHIKDQEDYNNHLDYIHYNPVKHNLVKTPQDWEYSSFKRYVTQGIYDLHWGSDQEILFGDNIGME